MATPFRLKRSAVSGKRPTLSDLQLGELALNTYDGYLFAERDTGGVGIGTTVALLTPWIENFGAQSIYYPNLVGIGTTNPIGSLEVFGHTELDNVNISGITTVSVLNVASSTSLYNLLVSGITTTSLLNVGVGGTIITTTNTPRVGINSSSPGYTLDVNGDINSSTDIKIDGVSILTTTNNDAVALAIALG